VAVILVYIVAKDLPSTAWNLQLLTNGNKQNIVRMLVLKVQSNVIESSFGELGFKIIKRDSRPSRPFPPLFERENYRNLVLLSQILKLYFWVIIFCNLDDHGLVFFFATVHMTREIHQSEIILSRQGSVTTRLPSEPLSVGGNLTQPREKQEAKHEK